MTSWLRAWVLLAICASCGARSDLEPVGPGSAPADSATPMHDTGDHPDVDARVEASITVPVDAHRDAVPDSTRHFPVQDAGHDAIPDARPDHTMGTSSDATTDAGHDGAADSLPAEASLPPKPSFRLIAPLSTSRVTRRRPTLRWSLPSGITEASVQLCSDRACTMPLGAPVQVGGTSYVPTTDLPIGVVFWRVLPSTTTGAASATWEFTVGAADTAVDSSWGTTLDVNGDGYADIVVGDDLFAFHAGPVSVDLGSAAGIPGAPDAVLAPPAGSVVFGDDVTSAGDVNGDGYADLLIGPYVYLGSPTGVAATPSVTLGYPKGIEGVIPGITLGAGDLNGDGYADVLATGDIATDAGVATGNVFLYFGSATGLAAQPAVTWPVVDVPKNDGAIDYRFGWTCTDVGDVNGDGYDDVVVTVVSSALTPGAYASLYFGSAAGFPTVPVSTLVQFGEVPDGDFEIPEGLGTVAAGDVNGDGNADVLFFTIVLGDPDYERASLFLGGAGGLGALPTTIVTLPDLGSNSSASAGDVNGDGYGDVVLGAEMSNGYLYLGNATGLSLAPATTLTGSITSEYGSVVASAGDVNGDGYADVVVGAPNGGVAGDAGSAYVYLGGATGLAATAATTLVGPADGGAAFGGSVFGATH